MNLGWTFTDKKTSAEPFTLSTLACGKLHTRYIYVKNTDDKGCRSTVKSMVLQPPERAGVFFFELADLLPSAFSLPIQPFPASVFAVKPRLNPSSTVWPSLWNPNLAYYPLFSPLCKDPIYFHKSYVPGTGIDFLRSIVRVVKYWRLQIRIGLLPGTRRPVKSGPFQGGRVLWVMRLRLGRRFAFNSTD